MQYKENKKITGGDYDKSLAVKCVNGTFVGKKADSRWGSFAGRKRFLRQPMTAYTTRQSPAPFPSGL